MVYVGIWWYCIWDLGWVVGCICKGVIGLKNVEMEFDLIDWMICEMWRRRGVRLK